MLNLYCSLKFFVESPVITSVSTCLSWRLFLEVEKQYTLIPSNFFSLKHLLITLLYFVSVFVLCAFRMFCHSSIFCVEVVSNE